MRRQWTRPLWAALGIGVTGFVASMSLSFFSAGATGSEEPGSGLASFTFAAHAPGYEMSEDAPPAQTHPQGQGSIPNADADLGYGPVGTATASIAWPGSIVANPGDVVLVSAGDKLPDDVHPVVHSVADPVRAQARHPAGPEESTFGGDPHVGGMTASAHDTGTEAIARMQNVESPTGSFGNVSAHSKTTLGQADGKVVAESRISDLTIAGGVITIGSVASTAHATTDGTKATGTAETLVSNAAVGGVPVTIDEQGLRVQGQGGEINPVLD